MNILEKQQINPYFTFFYLFIIKLIINKIINILYFFY